LVLTLRNKIKNIVFLSNDIYGKILQYKLYIGDKYYKLTDNIYATDQS